MLHFSVYTPIVVVLIVQLKYEYKKIVDKSIYLLKKIFIFCRYFVFRFQQLSSVL